MYGDSKDSKLSQDIQFICVWINYYYYNIIYIIVFDLFSIAKQFFILSKFLLIKDFLLSKF